jgi:thioredoxin 1
LSGAHENITFTKVDVDDLQDVAMKYGVSSMPTFLFFKNGEQVDKFIVRSAFHMG